jgi:hypothetical protein
MQGLRHMQQLGNVHLSESMKLSRLTCSICDEKGGLFVHFFQALENMFYLHSSNVPIRFGVILLSTKALEQSEAFEENSLIEDGSEKREAGIDVNDRQDLSTLVIRLFLQVKEDYGLESAFSLLNSVRVQCHFSLLCGFHVNLQLRLITLQEKSSDTSIYLIF